MPSLNSSVDSKSSIIGSLNLHLPNTRNCFPQNNSTKPLHSSWIRRLRLPNSAPPSQIHPPPPVTSDDADHLILDSGHRSTISTGESSTGSSISVLRSSFFRRLLDLCPERPDHDGGDGRRPFVGFGPFQVRKRRGLLPPVSLVGPTSTPPPPWAPPTVVSGHLDQDIDAKFDGIGRFGFVRQDSERGIEKPNFRNYRNLRKEEEEGREIGFRSGVHGSWINGKRNLIDGGMCSSSFQQKLASAASISRSPFSQFQMPLLVPEALNQHDYLRGSRLSSFVGSTRDEWPSSNESRFSQDLNYNAHDQMMYKQHLSGVSWHGGGNMNGAKCILRTKGGGMYHGIVDDANDCGAFLDPHLIHHNTVQRQYERQAPACPNEPDEAFSYGNMVRYKRAKTISSAFPAFTVNRSIDRQESRYE